MNAGSGRGSFVEAARNTAMFDNKQTTTGAKEPGGAAATTAGPGKQTQVEKMAATQGHTEEAAAASPSVSGVNLKTLQDFIGKHEGNVGHVYLDSRGFKTAGIGHLLAGSNLAVGTPVSAAQVTAWFQQDVAKAIAGARQDVGPAFDRLDEARKIVVIDMVFNLGSGGFGGFHATIQAIQNGQFAEAATHMLQSAWASQVGHRATEDAAIMRSGHFAGGGGTQGVGEGGGHEGGGGGGKHAAGGGDKHAPSIAQVRAGKAVIKQGETGPAVAEIQRHLHITADGDFGPHTKAAVEAFQRAHHLGVDGVVGEHTIALLDKAPKKPAEHHDDQAKAKKPSTGGASPDDKGHGKGKQGTWTAAPSLDSVQHGTAVLHEGEKGNAVKHVQRLLHVDDDGEYGPATKAAVVAFQHSHKMQRHDGEIDGHTLDILTKHPPGSVTGESKNGSEQRSKMLSVARSGSAGKRPDGKCYYHVCQFLIQCGGYGKIKNPYNQFPSGDLPYAHDFADLMNSGGSKKFGLEKLAMSSPYDAPAGSIVVVAAGSPGTAHPTAGDISVADGHGGFFNGGAMSYGGRAGWAASRSAKLLGVYVPV
ncbi:MAG TPA: peptidoglycan-binding protein [Kofleriaceae bacterium]|nr:peptidoglycan-binding protein [Kofleriaceae bacterium]